MVSNVMEALGFLGLLFLATHFSLWLGLLFVSLLLIAAGYFLDRNR